ncbi:MAG: YvrJ family protein [Bacteroidales bacterium]
MIQLIANLGFPIVVSAYLLTRIETKLDKLTLHILNLTHILEEDVEKEV